METGVVRLTGRASDLLDDPEVARLYLGASAQTRPQQTRPASTDATGDVAATAALETTRP
jgi:hypothetical protein